MTTLPDLHQAQELYAAANRQGLLVVATSATIKHLGFLCGSSKRCCRISSLHSLSCATGLLIADLSWNSIEQVPQGLPSTLISLNLGHNKLSDLPSTLSVLALLPRLRILQLKVAQTVNTSAQQHQLTTLAIAALAAPNPHSQQPARMLQCCAGKPFLLAALLSISSAAGIATTAAL